MSASSISTPITAADAESDLAEFDRTTSRWGRLTMIAGLILSVAGPLYLVFFTGLDISAAQLWTAFAAVAAVFAIIWIVEPVTYFPILGPAAMYQAFMIGNISSKLLPSALVAQTRIGAKPGTRRGDFAAVAAICGAAAVHLVSLALFVGILGTWLISIIPVDVIDVARLYVLPSVLGAVIVQAILTIKQLRITIIAVAIALLVQFVLLPLVPAIAFLTTGIAVIGTIIVSWLARDRKPAAAVEN
ncbi:hypothetical protein [Arthrobacter crystallopoietes]|uniref:Uncharacterized protein n=1 Tax=Crystallibacter crystallopoietes TaxID=37928 RepID=A0A1H1AFS5_9MICC|nr:hypothetical protein [Arthrobacter crystallopoietes]AUI51546.1 hypothetical protein AC20117_12785 [Arthrobacter crystallopoietes]SDQ38532.1 hypothetical protein SAMN04489742_0907 [Arthrobacter crystallopoietes]